MTFYHSFKNYISKMVSIKRNKVIREKEVGRTIKGHKKKGEFE
jgi:hypothetical protein